jgi:sulfite dehydrogenase (cytochrome) subunit B
VTITNDRMHGAGIDFATKIPIHPPSMLDIAMIPAKLGEDLGKAAMESGRLPAQCRRNHARHRGVRETIMKHGLLLVLYAVLALAPVPLLASPISYALPAETAAFKPGPNVDVVNDNCTACHSADYINTRPRGAKDKKGFWQVEVTKMINVYGARSWTPTSPVSLTTWRRSIERGEGRRALIGPKRVSESTNPVDDYDKCHRSCEKLRNCHDIGGFWPNPAIV